MTQFTCLIRWLRPLALFAVTALAAPAQADVDLRVVSRPVADPIKAFVRVTDSNGNPVSGLTIADFAVVLDGTTLNGLPLSLPPAQDPGQRVSVVFAMDYSGSVQSTALNAMRDAVIDFIGQMVAGDHAAIIKFNDTNPDRASVVQAFTAIDDGGGNDAALIAAVNAPYPGTGTPLLEAVDLAVDTIVNPGIVLPNGPKVIILISDGGENSSSVSQSTVVANAQANSIAVFTVGVGDISTDPAREELLNSLAEDTGADYFPAPDDAGIAAAYVTISELLNNEYLITLPQTAVIDCGQHALAVTAQGETATVTFTRCDTTPDDYNFTSQTGVAPSAVVTSNVATIVGIDTPTSISVTGGEYSVGCGATFTSAPGTIAFNETVCVRHTASASFSTAVTTVLIVGGVSSDFSSTTSAAPPPPPPPRGGGGGATGVLELLLGLGALFGARRRRA